MKNYYSYTDYKDAEDFKRLDFIVNEIKHNCYNGAKILDIGCGNGNIARALGSIGYEVFAIDIDSISIRKAIESNPFPNVIFKELNSEELSTTNKFNAIICSEVLEHLNDYKKVIETCYSVLETDGILIVTVPNGYGPREVLITKPVQKLIHAGFEKHVIKLKKTLGFGKGTLQSSNPDLTHIQFFSKKKLLQEFKAANFELTKFKKADSLERVIPFSFLTRKFYKLQEFDCKIAEYLPTFMISGFYTSWKVKRNQTLKI